MSSAMPKRSAALFSVPSFMEMLLPFRLAVQDVVEALLHEGDDVVVIEGVEGFFADFAKFYEAGVPQDA